MDPLGDRVMKNVPCIARYPLTRDELWHESGKHIRPKSEQFYPDSEHLGTKLNGIRT